MKKTALFIMVLVCSIISFSQSAAVTSWFQNTTATGTYYVSGNSTAISNGLLVNCQKVEYSNDYVYITASGVPAYTTGPFLDGNPSQAQDQNAIFKFPLNPQQNNGALTSTSMGNIGIFIDGTALFNSNDGVAWDPSTNSLCGGPGNPACPGGPNAAMDWNRDAVIAEMDGFDCSKGHPAMGNYHHHQNPSAFKLDLSVVSTICNLYDADGLYVIDSAQHSPLLGFAYDGFPVYGAYGYNNTDGTGGITRIRSGYQLQSITTRNNGPAVNVTYFLGYFNEDYEFISHPNDQEYLDEHNGRFCVTPEYPNGTYAYFATVDSNWNSAYPYAVGPTFYGDYSNAAVSSVNETTTIYTPGSTILPEDKLDKMKISVFPNPGSDLIAIQVGQLVKNNLKLELIDMSGRIVKTSKINTGSTIAFFDIQTLYEGAYFIKLSNSKDMIIKQVMIMRE